MSRTYGFTSIGLVLALVLSDGPRATAQNRLPETPSVKASESPSTSAPTAAESRWDPRRVTSPETVQELRALESTVKRITEQVMPATVGLFVGNSAGSGVIVQDDGLILTAAHVVAKPGNKVRILLANGKAVWGVVLGINRAVDSGMVRITSDIPEDAEWPGAEDGKWPSVKIGKSADLKPGQWVISLGHHGGYRPSRTAPLRLGRYESYNNRDKSLRSDCTLVGGDSGGPLFNLEGELVGIHSRIGLFLDYNHHISIDAFRNEWDRLAQKNKPTDGSGTPSETPRVTMGITLDAEQSTPTILEVKPGSPAAKAGLKPGDVILKVEGDAVPSRKALRELVQQYDVGSRLKVQIQRGERTLMREVTLAEAKSNDP